MDKKTKDEQRAARENLLKSADKMMGLYPSEFDVTNAGAFIRATVEYLKAEKAVEEEDAIPAVKREAILKVVDYVAAAYLRAHAGDVPSLMKWFDVARWFTNMPATLLSKALQVPEVPEPVTQLPTQLRGEKPRN